MRSFLRCIATAVGLNILFGSAATLSRAEEAASESQTVNQASQGLSGTEVFNRMLPTTCWLRLEYMVGDVPWERMGTGWVYDIGRRLVVTNEHVVHGLDNVTAYFPQELDGELQHDPRCI